MTRITTDTLQGLTRLNIENDKLKLGILPEIGAKMISIIDTKTGREFISLSGRHFRSPVYGSDYGDYDISGFDECFPTLGGCHYPEGPWAGTVVPAHGELWSQPWNSQIQNDKVVLSVCSVRFAYEFKKTVSLDDDKILIHYELKNLSSSDFRYLWSAHPLLAITPESRILLPKIEQAYVDSSKYERLGKLLDTLSWPKSEQTNGKIVDLSVIGPVESDRGDKIFVGPLKEGWCGWCDPKTGDFIRMEFPVDKVAYVGLWINLGGWPEDKPCYNIALEPCTGYPDRLDIAIENGHCGVLRGSSVNSWDLNIRIGRREHIRDVFEKTNDFKLLKTQETN
jgi:hypothetical protein